MASREAGGVEGREPGGAGGGHGGAAEGCGGAVGGGRGCEVGEEVRPSTTTLEPVDLQPQTRGSQGIPGTSLGAARQGTEPGLSLC